MLRLLLFTIFLLMTTCFGLDSRSLTLGPINRLLLYFPQSTLMVLFSVFLFASTNCDKTCILTVPAPGGDSRSGWYVHHDQRGATQQLQGSGDLPSKCEHSCLLPQFGFGLILIPVDNLLLTAASIPNILIRCKSGTSPK